MNSETEILKIVNDKKKLSSHYYNNFEKNLKKGRLSKSSEFLWGALCSLLYAVALFYGKKLNSHAQIVSFAKELSDLIDLSIYKGIKSGEELHANFYHNFLDKEGVEIKRKEIDLAIVSLSKILEERIHKFYE